MSGLIANNQETQQETTQPSTFTTPRVPDTAYNGNTQYYDEEPSLVKQASQWLIESITDHRIYALAAFISSTIALNALVKPKHGSNIKDQLLKDTIKIMDPLTPAFRLMALEILVDGTPDELIHCWTPDHLKWWVDSVSEKWCTLNNCNARSIPVNFIYNVLSPVTSDENQLRQEIQFRTSGEPLDLRDPRQATIDARRKAVCATLDSNPTTKKQWMSELTDSGQLKKAHTQLNENHSPVKIMRESFLETFATTTQHTRYKNIRPQGSLIDVTSQYIPSAIPHPDAGQRYGVYTCSTIDGDNWWVLDITNEQPGLHGFPALIGYAHKASNGRCITESMDIWLSTIDKNGESTTLNPEATPTYSITINLADILKGVPREFLNSDSCSLAFWKNRQWDTISVTEPKPGFLQAVLPRFALYRLQSNKQTALFTIDTQTDEINLWSWPSASPDVDAAAAATTAEKQTMRYRNNGR